VLLRLACMASESDQLGLETTKLGAGDPALFAPLAAAPSILMPAVP